MVTKVDNVLRDKTTFAARYSVIFTKPSTEPACTLFKWRVSSMFRSHLDPLG